MPFVFFSIPASPEIHSVCDQQITKAFIQIEFFFFFYNLIIDSYKTKVTFKRNFEMCSLCVCFHLNSNKRMTNRERKERVTELVFFFFFFFR